MARGAGRLACPIVKVWAIVAVGAGNRMNHLSSTSSQPIEPTPSAMPHPAGAGR
jgi:hypothetical protein